MTTDPKNDTLFSPTFEIEENKVPLYFGLEFKWTGNGHFSFDKFSIIFTKKQIY